MVVFGVWLLMIACAPQRAKGDAFFLFVGHWCRMYNQFLGPGETPPGVTLDATLRYMVLRR
jgi:hypothetical protein